MKRAWAIQCNSGTCKVEDTSSETSEEDQLEEHPVDVDAECIKAFERRLFKFSPESEMQGSTSGAWMPGSTRMGGNRSTYWIADNLPQIIPKMLRSY